MSRVIRQDASPPPLRKLMLRRCYQIRRQYPRDPDGISRTPAPLATAPQCRRGASWTLFQKTEEGGRHRRDPGDSVMAPDAAISTADGGCKASIYPPTSQACHLLKRRFLLKNHRLDVRLEHVRALRIAKLLRFEHSFLPASQTKFFALRLP